MLPTKLGEVFQANLPENYESSASLKISVEQIESRLSESFRSGEVSKNLTFALSFVTKAVSRTISECCRVRKLCVLIVTRV